MKLGIFDFEVVEVKMPCSDWYIWFQPTLKIDGKIVQTFGLWKNEKDAHDAGIKKLEELFQGALDQLTKPRFRAKSKVVDVVQWFPGIILKENVRHSFCEGYNYRNQPIKPGDWVVDGKVITDEDFEKDYEVTT